MSFKKFDKGKPRFDLIDPDFELELAEILTEGASKYGDENWKEADPCEGEARYYAALRRHLNAWSRGEDVDLESQKSHLAHAAACLMFLRHFERAFSGPVDRDCIPRAIGCRISNCPDCALDDMDEPGA